MPRPTNTVVRRKEIVEGLLRAMAHRGYAETTIPEIARQAKLTPGLLHYHFRSKKEILLGLLDHLAQGLVQRIDRRLSEVKGERARLMAYLDAHVALGPDADRDAVFCWVHIGAEALRDPAIQKAFEQALKEDLWILETLLGEVLRGEGKSIAKIRELAASLLAAIQGAYQVGIASPGTIPRGSMAPLLRHMAEGLLAAQSPAPSKNPESKGGPR